MIPEFCFCETEIDGVIICLTGIWNTDLSEQMKRERAAGKEEIV